MRLTASLHRTLPPPPLACTTDLTGPVDAPRDCTTFCTVPVLEDRDEPDPTRTRLDPLSDRRYRRPAARTCGDVSAALPGAGSPPDQPTGGSVS